MMPRRLGAIPGLGFVAFLIGCLAGPAGKGAEGARTEPDPHEGAALREVAAVPLAPFAWDDEARVVRGELAPDFELPHLRFEAGPDGKPVGIIDENDKYRLAAHIGERPICLIMSSFT